MELRHRCIRFPIFNLEFKPTNVDTPKDLKQIQAKTTKKKKGPRHGIYATEGTDTKQVQAALKTDQITTPPRAPKLSVCFLERMGIQQQKRKNPFKYRQKHSS